jgi:signal peptide peptidase SppA
MSHHLAHIADRVLNRPLMIMPEKLAIISSVLEGRIGIEAVAPSADVQIPDSSRHVGTYEQDPAKPEGVKKPYRTTADGIAIIPVIGSLVGRGGWLSALSGIQSYENLKFALGAAAADKSVRAMVLDIDSPGGEAVGAFETADAVRAAAAQKEVVAVATGLCCSAAYAIASAASSVVTTKSSVIGSIGVVMLHADYSHALHERGVVPTLIHAGKRKVDGTPYKPLTDEVKAELKAEVEKFNSLFVATVAEGRKSLTPDAILAMEAGTYIGAAAVKVKLADSVGSLEAVLARLSKQTSPVGSSGLQLSIQVTAETKPVEVDLDRVSKIIAAGHRAGLLEFAETLASHPAQLVSTEAALGLIDFVKRDLAKNKAEPHPPGLVFGPVSGGPLFVSPESHSTTDHGWGDVLADVNRRRFH